MTYGTDRVAKAFGVLENLPCILMMDAFASDHVVVFEMKEAQLPHFFTVLRSAMHKLTQDPRFEAFNNALCNLQHFREERIAMQSKIATQKRMLSNVPVDSEAAQTIERIHQAMAEALRVGSHREFRTQLKTLHELVGDSVPTDLDENASQRIVGLGKTIRALGHYEGQKWPLRNENETGLHETISKHVVRLLPEISAPPSPKQDDVASLKKSLIAEQSILIHRVVALLPDQSEAILTMQDVYQRRRQAIERELDSLGHDFNALRESAERALNICLADDAPSLTKAIRKADQEKKLRLFAATVKDKTIAFASKLLEPDTLIKLVGVRGA